MTDKLRVIYIPGIGDDNPTNQARLVSTWQWWGVESELFQMKWSDQRPWDDKFNELLARIDKLSKNGHKVSLVGASAGASAAINAFAERQNAISGVVLIAGKVNNPDSIGTKYRNKNPSFLASALQCTSSLNKLSSAKRQTILSRYAAFDELVSKKDSYIKDANNQKILIAGHVLIIATQLFFGAPSFLRFLKKQAK